MKHIMIFGVCALVRPVHAARLRRRVRPLPDACVKFIFTEDFSEHIEKEQCTALIKECHRVLAPGGVMRMRTPSLHLIAEQHLTRDPEFGRKRLSRNPTLRAKHFYGSNPGEGKLKFDMGNVG